MVFCATPFFLLFSFFINYQINCHNYTKLIGSTIKLCVRDLVRCSASIVYILEMRKKNTKQFANEVLNSQQLEILAFGSRKKSKQALKQNINIFQV